MKITFVIHNVYGIGGTIRTTLNLATVLADRHDVTVVSMMRHRARPRFAIDLRINIVPLVDLRDGSTDSTDPRLHQPAGVFPAAEKRYKQYSRLTDQRAQEYLQASDADVIIGTRPGINVYLARFAPPGALRIAQEHLTHDHHTKKLRAELARHYRNLDAVVTTTQADAAAYRSKMRLPGVRVLAIPNGVPDPGLPGDGARAPVIAAAGRLVRSKRFDLLVEAFTDVAAKHPDWSLRIYGAGADKERLQTLIDNQDLGGRAKLMGAVAPIETEFAKASIVASASDFESFGMTLVEAMRCGTPVVATDCPLGPAEIINDGVDGRLVPQGDRKALAAALCDLITDEPGRRHMGQAAQSAAERFAPSNVARVYEDLFTNLITSRRVRIRPHHKSRLRRGAGLVFRLLRR